VVRFSREPVLRQTPESRTTRRTESGGLFDALPVEIHPASMGPAGRNDEAHRSVRQNEPQSAAASCTGWVTGKSRVYVVNASPGYSLKGEAWNTIDWFRPVILLFDASLNALLSDCKFRANTCR
jgi:hypothetical protein